MRIPVTLLLLLLLQAPSVAAQAGPIVVRLTVPGHITLVTGQPYRTPLRIRAMRVDDGRPAQGVPVTVFVDRVICSDEVLCGAYSRIESYGYFEERGGAGSKEARFIEVLTDFNGEVTLSRLVGGSVPLQYRIAFFISPYDQTTFQQQVLFSFLQVNQVDAPHTIPATGRMALALLLLAVLGGAIRYRR
jgi:hypothetical protein